MRLRELTSRPQGKARRGGRGGGDTRGRPDDEQSTADRAGWRSYPTLVKENEKLQTYYDALLQLPDEEKQQYWDALRRELPNSFRFCGSKG